MYELEAFWLMNTEYEILGEEQDIKEMAYDEIIDCVNNFIKAVKRTDKQINKKYCEFCGAELNEDNTALPNMCWECKYGMDE